MLPVQDTAHVTEGLALRIGQYLSDAGLQALLTAFLDQVQDAEDVLWDVLHSQLLSRTFPTGTAQGQAGGPPDRALLQLADLIGCPALGLTTTELAFLIPIWLLARKSHGTSEDLIGILAAAFGAGNFGYAEYFPAAYRASAWTAPDETLIGPITQALRIARPPGVSAVLAWGTEPGATFFFGDTQSGFPGSGLKNTIIGDGARGLLSSVGT